MSTLIFRTTAPYITALMVLFSIFVLLRGHNEPGGGFIGGLIAASAIAIYGIAYGVEAVRRALYIHPNALAGVGLAMSALAGIAAVFAGKPLLTGLWFITEFGGMEVPLSSVLVFDVGVYLVVVGSVASIALALEEND
ncbi:Na+/H+ antiporter subunit B [Acuticoccus sp. MNP-M23]|uniref:Na+/H+ antiporter subunit B n=1 Tax=Acuticoccus sp. MNP-M23 TaxID=3072793 RepID=UPI002815BA09|nr:Na+/H+ antiporter subunit B [Acuticoccus sp. MNP-M23]WMS42031.1 Na+/H+ antiporter subunit B [Acuticoccus sp. MNP-M23]